jgi:hypothetical protein
MKKLENQTMNKSSASPMPEVPKTQGLHAPALLTGPTPEDRWKPKYKYHHVPTWMKKTLRLARLKSGEWKVGIHARNNLRKKFHNLWDHWGCIKVGGEWHVFTQPYGCADDEAEAFALEIGCNLRTQRPGPWHPKTVMYIFSPNATSLGKGGIQ